MRFCRQKLEWLFGFCIFAYVSIYILPHLHPNRQYESEVKSSGSHLNDNTILRQVFNDHPSESELMNGAIEKSKSNQNVHLRDINENTMHVVFDAQTTENVQYADPTDKQCVANLSMKYENEIIPEENFVISLIKNAYVSADHQCEDVGYLKQSATYTIDYPAIPMLYRIACNLDNILDVIILRIMPIYEVLLTTNAKIIIPTKCGRQIASLLQLIGLNPTSTMQLYRGKSLETSTEISLCRVDHHHLASYKRLRDILENNMKLKPPPSNSTTHLQTQNASLPLRYIVLITTQHRTTGINEIVNNRRVLTFLRAEYRNNFKVLYTDKDTNTASVSQNLLRNARLIIGLTTPSLWHTVLAPEGATVLEIVPWHQLTNAIVPHDAPLNHIRRLVAGSGLTHWRMLCTALSPKSGCIISLKKLESALTQILS